MGDLCNELYSELCGLTPRQRSAVLRMLDGLSETNCGWVLYRMRDVLAELVDAASSGRERKARLRVRRSAAAAHHRL